MKSLNLIEAKLTSFIRKFYVNQLLKGSILFVSTGVLYFIVILFTEHVLWLDTFWRGILFWIFVLIEVGFFLTFIIFPWSKLIKIGKGLDEFEAAKMIGQHFPIVGDKLLNIIQLKQESDQTDLLLAGIEQKSKQLQPISFSSAINFRDNLRFLRYASVPALIILIIFYSGNFNGFAESFSRVVNYKMEFERPAPFAFVVLNERLEVREDEAFQLEIGVEGAVMPEEVSISYNDQSYFLTSDTAGVFEHSFEGLNEDMEFYLVGNGVTSGPHRIELLEVPRMLDFEMHLNYPAYTKLKDEMRDGSGDAIVPEGTEVTWTLKTRSTDEVRFIRTDTIERFTKEKEEFSFAKTVYEDMPYQVSTSNQRVKEYERLEFRLKVRKDEYPVLELSSLRDSTGVESWHFHGKVSDDYGIRKVDLVYYEADNPDQVEVMRISDPPGAVTEFLSSFPDTLDLEKGAPYEFYFQVFDNDVLSGFKSIKSEVFSFRLRTDKELSDEKVVQQGQAIQGMSEMLEDLKISEKELNEISRLQKEKANLNFNDRKKFAGFIKRKQQQNEAMENFSEKLESGLEKGGDEDDSDLREGLQERLDRNENVRQEDEKLLEELEKLSEKIVQEGLGEKLEELSKNKRNQERSLEQLLELTKKYYVEQSLRKTVRELEDLSREQDNLSERLEGDQSGQDSLINRFKEIRESLDVLEEENMELERPVSLERDTVREDEIEEDQKKALELLEQEMEENAARKQREAADKMREMSSKIKEQGMKGSMEMMVEDSDALRQILDNLIVFSFEQEALLMAFRNGGANELGFGQKLRRQNILKEHFKHVDDSLYSLALRNPMVNEDITELLTDVIYDLDKSLERLAQNQLSQGMGSQQYVVTSSNELALLLSKILGSMQEMMNSASGSGGGKGDMQLSDIIKRQEDLSREMREGVKDGHQEKEQGQNGSEEKSGELFEIFKKQQILRKALEDELKKWKTGDEGEELGKEMERLEEDLLNEGFERKNLERMIQIKQRLLDMEESEMQKEKHEKRESETSQKDYENNMSIDTPRAEEYFQMNEILNRHILPLRQIYKRKVQEYFEQRVN